MAGEVSPPNEPRKIVVKKGHKTFVSYPRSPTDELMNPSGEPPSPRKAPVEVPVNPLWEKAHEILLTIPKGERDTAREQLKALGLSDNAIGIVFAREGRDDLA